MRERDKDYKLKYTLSKQDLTISITCKTNRCTYIYQSNRMHSYSVIFLVYIHIYPCCKYLTQKEHILFDIEISQQTKHICAVMCLCVCIDTNNETIL